MSIAENDNETRADVLDTAIKFLWSAGLDTADIAARLNMPESIIANRLAVIRDAGK